MGYSSKSTAPSERVRIRRKRDRGSYEREVINAILDEALIAHVGITDQQGNPVVTPTLHARDGELLYLHGSKASRTLKRMSSGAPVCVTVSLLDGVVLARSAMHHSVNYRSVMLIGEAQEITEPSMKLHALRKVIEHVIPGRWDEIREPSENELKATAVLSVSIGEASAKIRTGQPIDDSQDMALEVWAGVLPISTVALAPEPDPQSVAITPPEYLCNYQRPGW